MKDVQSQPQLKSYISDGNPKHQKFKEQVVNVQVLLISCQSPDCAMVSKGLLIDTPLQMPTTTFLAKPAVSLGAPDHINVFLWLLLKYLHGRHADGPEAGCHPVTQENKDHACTCPDQDSLT